MFSRELFKILDEDNKHKQFAPQKMVDPFSPTKVKTITCFFLKDNAKKQTHIKKHAFK